MKLREKSIIVLEALFQGHIIELKEIGRVGLSTLNEFYLEAENMTGESIGLPLNTISLDAFIRICNKLTDDEAFLIASNTALNKSRKARK